MAVVTLKSTNLTAFDAGTLVGTTYSGGKLRSQVATFEVGAADSIASIYRFARVKSNWRMTGIWMTCDAITSAAGDVGIYQTAGNGGAVVDVDAYATATSIATAITILPVNLLFEVKDIANCRKLVWEDAGLTADSGRFYDLAMTLTTAATGAGTLCFETQYVID